jgi:sialic acid synthase SpsE
MSTIILDYSANSHKNDLMKIQSAIDSVANIDTKKHNIIFKSQLFVMAGDNIPCHHGSFDFMYNRCKELGYECTSSVFDRASLDFLLGYDIPFVKIANNRKLDYLIGEIPRKIPVYVSYDCNRVDNLNETSIYNKKDRFFNCVSEYPASIESYSCSSNCNISDHTIGFELFNKYKPLLYEKHFIMPGDDGLDAGPFAVTPEDLKEIL